MERYIEISVMELFQMIEADNTENVYFKDDGGYIKSADDYTHLLRNFKTRKWFKREVIK